jgi:hypothetical protein
MREKNKLKKNIPLQIEKMSKYVLNRKGKIGEDFVKNIERSIITEQEYPNK